MSYLRLKRRHIFPNSLVNFDFFFNSSALTKLSLNIFGWRKYIFRFEICGGTSNYFPVFKIFAYTILV